MAETSSLSWPDQGDVRAVIDAVKPCVDDGRFAVKHVAGEPFEVTAHAFADGHDVLRVLLLWREAGHLGWREVEMAQKGNDVWLAAFTPPEPGRYNYTVVAWVDGFASWRHELSRRVDPADIRIAAQVGAMLIDATAVRASAEDRNTLAAWAADLNRAAADDTMSATSLKALALDANAAAMAARYPDRSLEARNASELPLVVDRERARYSSWYELFPRSASPESGRHGTFKDVEARLPAIAEMGFDVLYLPPIHPIGRLQRKGKNNALSAAADDVGSPWAIGAEEGGHKAILPALGTAEDFKSLVAKAASLKMDVALDIAFQCAPDHPYVKAHPAWFKRRPDGSVQYAENPPKKYQDIYPFDFETEDWRALWEELKSVFDHWIAQGVTIFRIDNPHTKAFPFWEWVIDTIKREHPGVIFLAEAFTRPKVMHRLAKLGFTQSYTYFTWRQTKHDLTAYFTELTQPPGRDYFRPNAWPTTPDILTEQFHGGERAVFMARLVLAATLSANYGIYGPAYELMEHTPREPGSEEFRDSEKYQLRTWDLGASDSLAPFITRVNRIRRENSALQSDHSLRFFNTDNDQLIAYAKRSRTEDSELDNVVLTIVNLDPHNAQSGWIDLDADTLGIDATQSFQVHDELSDQRFLWQGLRKFVMLDPQRTPAHIFVLRRRQRSERDFDYFL